MELREFAERVLFATTLDEKLRCPDIVTDEQPGSPIAAPKTPGRPEELRFKPLGTGKADFPGVRRLEQERERGRLLHFFANHELLATELMALVLLRFPDAPAAFRQGVLETLKDEQIHTRLYLERMKDCAIHFGDIPVSGYFWRAVSIMKHPIDYVASLSLTFEQANLDFCRHFARGFQAVGDAGTARLLDRVYRDEIGHVAHGLKWFRRWKNPEQSDWEAFCRQLTSPLSPQRAKGITLNIEGRRAAGFDPAFISELSVYSQSRGRTPAVFVFNPFAEGRIARGRSFCPVKHQRLLAADLSNLPQFLGRQDDIVLVERRPSVAFLTTIQQAGFALPEFVEIGTSADPALRVPAIPLPSSDGRHPPLASGSARESAASSGPSQTLSTLARRKLGRLRPWAWGPDSVELLEPFFLSVTGDRRSANQCFNERIAQLYTKAWSAAFLRRVLASVRGDNAPPDITHHASRVNHRDPKPLFSYAPLVVHPDWLCSELEVGVPVSTLEGAFDAIQAIRRQGHHRLLVKESLGLAGHNAIRLWEPEVLETQRRWIRRAMQDGRQLVVEPWLERELDFSIQLEMTDRRLKLCGYTGLINDRKGQFLANLAAPNCRARIPADVTALIREATGGPDPIGSLYSRIFSLLEEELRIAGYLGPVGIDAFVYRTSSGGVRLKPIVEINPRYTMGRLTVELMKQTSPGSHGLLRLVSRSKARAEGFEDFAAFARALQESFPLQLKGDPSPRIREGALCLNDPSQAQACLAVLHVSRSRTTLTGLAQTLS